MKPGDQLYIPSAFYISHGEDDFQGGLATVEKIEETQSITYVHFKENKRTKYNKVYIEENQEKWSKEYEGRTAHPDPDVNTPWLQNGDITNTGVYRGPDIW